MKHGRMLLAAGLAAALSAVGARVARAQGDTTAAGSRARMDSAFARARQLVMAGQTAAGRQIGDSILAATPPGTPAYGNALYGAAMLAPTAAAAQLAYQRIIVEYPLSAHAGDALLQLAQMERSEGDRAGAAEHLQRFLRENPASRDRGRAGLWLARLLFEQNDDLRACGVLDTARAATSAGDIELLNQMNFYSGRCAAAAATAAADSTARADSIKAAAAARREPASRGRERAPARERPRPEPTTARAEGRYAVQLAAYDTRAQADRLVRALHARGVEARIEGERKPFRVRAGHYNTRAAAERALADFKKMGYRGFITTADGR
ncbi:MAG: SPOR domain-containing protein [Gemmatimonadota bacterium]|nr:SPOR domain-containing protein [Gemmatimonadota bacterium]